MRLFLLLASFAILAVFLVWPIVLTVRGAFVDGQGDASAFTLRHIAGVFREPVLIDGLVNSFIIALLTTALSLAIATPLALIARRYDFFGKTLLNGLLLMPLILPPFVGAIGMRQVLGRYGAFNALLGEWGWIDPSQPIDWLGGGTWSILPGIFEFDSRILGVVLLEALHLYPIVYLNVAAALANLDPALEQAAENLGASRRRRFWKITFPLIRPGVFAGCTIVFIWSFTELGTPLMFDLTRVTPVQVFWGIQEMETSARPYALVVVMLAFALLFYFGGKVFFGGRAYTATTRASVAAVTKKLRLPGALLAAMPFVLVTALAVLPHLGVIFTSFAEAGSWYRSMWPSEWTGEHYSAALTHNLAADSIRNSLLYALGAMALDIVLGLLLATLIARPQLLGRIGRWLAKGLDALAMLPLAVPGLVMAFGYVAISIQIDQWFGSGGGGEPPGWLQVLGQDPNPVLFLVIAYAVRRLPYVVRSAVAGLEQTPLELEEAALVLGASRWRMMRKVVAPLILANLIAGGLLAFSFAMLEVSDSLILAQTAEHYPITKAIYELFERLGDGPYIASAMGVWGMALLALTLIGATMMLGKKMGLLFRV